MDKLRDNAFSHSSLPPSLSHKSQKQREASNQQRTENKPWHLKHGNSRRIRQIIVDAVQMSNVGDFVTFSPIIELGHK